MLTSHHLPAALVETSAEVQVEFCLLLRTSGAVVVSREAVEVRSSICFLLCVTNLLVLFFFLWRWWRVRDRARPRALDV